MYCQIIPNRVLLKIAREENDKSKRLNILHGIQESIRHRYNRSIIYNNRALFANIIPEGGDIERIWFYDCENKEDFPPTPEIKIEEKHEEHKPIQSLVPLEHSNNMGKTYDFFRDIYGHKSFDKQSATVKFYSNYGQNYENAFWDGQRMVFGNGSTFRDLGSVIDVVAHEFTHAITQYSSNMIYENQSGALNESVSDVFGSLVTQYVNNKQPVDKANWLIGPGIWSSDRFDINEYRALRSMSEPGTAYPGDYQPSHMRDLYTGTDDNGGVHINSGIPNKAFYLTATAIGGYAWEKAGLIWYKTLEDTTLIKPDSDFNIFANGTYQKALALFPDESKHVKNAWNEVGIYI